MTLGRLLLAWLVVAVWFCIATFATTYLVTSLSIPPGQAVDGGVPSRLLKWRLVEALLLTLLASLWFDSLGSGAWWLPILLISALVTTPTWLRNWTSELPKRALFAGAISDLARYLIAGGLLAWRLS